MVDYGEFEQAITKALMERGLQPEINAITKVIQLFETQVVRFGVMLIGEANTGKSTCYKILADALTDLRENHDSEDQDH